MVLEVLRHRRSGVQQDLDLGVSEVAGHDKGSCQRQACHHGVFRQFSANLVHGAGEIDLHHVVDRGGVPGGEMRLRGLWQEACGVGLELLDEHTFSRDLAKCLAISRAGDGDRDRQRGTVAGEPDHPHVMAEVLAAELGADPEVAGQFQHP